MGNKSSLYCVLSVLELCVLKLSSHLQFIINAAVNTQDIGYPINISVHIYLAVKEMCILLISVPFTNLITKKSTHLILI